MAIIETLRGLAASFIVREKAEPLTAVVAEITGINAALAQVDAERATAKETLARADERMDELLVADATAQAKAAQRACTQEADDTLRALELFERAQRRRLAELDQERRRLMLNDLLARWHARAVTTAAAMQKVQTQVNGLQAIVQEAMDAGFGNQAVALMPPPPLTNFIVVMDPQLTAWTAALASRAPGYVAPAPPMPPQAFHALPRQKPGPAAAPGPMLVKRDRAPAPVEGGIPVVVIRAGYQTPDGVQCVAGETITLAPDIAMTATRAGAVEFAEGDKP